MNSRNHHADHHQLNGSGEDSNFTTPEREGERGFSCASEPAGGERCSSWSPCSPAYFIRSRNRGRSTTGTAADGDFGEEEDSAHRSTGDDAPAGGRRSGRTSTTTFALRFRDHVKMGPKLTETVKGKLKLGTKILKEGGWENVFKQIFGQNEGEEQLLKASQCYLSTTTGPIAGILFISTLKVAFCSDMPIAVRAPCGKLLIRWPYKVVIPVKVIKLVKQSENVEKPSQKYIEIVTEDDHEFWFMGFLRFEKAFTNLQKVVSKVCNEGH
ncbi:unnamed protein product [Linum trigynum]|uniref:GRAM domain-containing protein n=1 Tax=Linum trigynum TaxID=586398 RepID=A0AAV2GJV6_9ROSI